VTRRHLVFAYGSNLCAAQMRRRCPGARFAGDAELFGWRLAFRGHSPSRLGAVATIERDPCGAVPGVIWLLGDGDLRQLDRHEGAPRTYARRRVTLLAYGRACDAQAYVMRPAAAGAPSAHYYGIIARAYREFGFDLAGLRQAAFEAAGTVPDDDGAADDDDEEDKELQ
jgi:hypothetical protein